VKLPAGLALLHEQDLVVAPHERRDDVEDGPRAAQP
jgi:hypothetical protein